MTVTFLCFWRFHLLNRQYKTLSIINCIFMLNSCLNMNSKYLTSIFWKTLISNFYFIFICKVYSVFLSRFEAFAWIFYTHRSLGFWRSQVLAFYIYSSSLLVCFWLDKSYRRQEMLKHCRKSDLKKIIWVLTLLNVDPFLNSEVYATTRQKFFAVYPLLKVPSGQIGSAWEWYHWKAL